MSYTLQNLKNLLKTSLSVKDLKPELQKQFAEIAKGGNVALKRKLYFILTNEKQWLAKIDRTVRKEVDAILDNYESNLVQIMQKQTYARKK